VTTWNIEPSGVQGTCNRTVEVIRGFEGDSRTYGESMTAAAGGCGQGDGGAQLSAYMVMAALSGFNEHRKEALSAIVSRAMASVNGAVDATRAYINGDLEMAANAQQNAAEYGTVPPRPLGGPM
jgi:hypothetical protein